MMPTQLEDDPISLQAVQIAVKLTLPSLIGADDGCAPLEQQATGRLTGARKPNDHHPLASQIQHGYRHTVPGSGFRVGATRRVAPTPETPHLELETSLNTFT
jgi:hypothetical protein